MRGLVAALALVLLPAFARADIAGGASIALPLVSYTYDSATFQSVFYTPDPSNSLCPSGQYALTSYSGPVAFSFAHQQGTYCNDPIANPMYAVWRGPAGAFPMNTYRVFPTTFDCPAGAIFDQSSQNCLGSVTNTGDTVAGWAWGFGVISICAVLGGALGGMVGFLEGLSDA